MVLIILAIICFALSIYVDYRKKYINIFLFITASIGLIFVIVSIPYLYIETLKSYIGVVLISIGAVLSVPVLILGTIKHLKNIFKK